MDKKVVEYLSIMQQIMENLPGIVVERHSRRAYKPNSKKLALFMTVVVHGDDWLLYCIVESSYKNEPHIYTQGCYM